jgi:glycosyltransferase involved in cell wall biosynthesis
MKKIRVLELIDRPFLGGGQITVLTLASRLDRERFEVTVASGGDGPLVDELRRLGIRHIPVSFGKTSGPAGVRGLAAALRADPVDILHTHGGIAGLYGRMAAKRARVPAVVHTIHGIHYLHYRNVLARRAFVTLERWLAKSTDAVVFVSEADLEKGRRLRLAVPGRERLIRNGVDISFLKPSFDRGAKRAELGFSAGPLVVAVSRLHRQKGLTYLLSAVPALAARFPDVQVVVVGGGPLESRLRAEAEKAGLKSRAAFLGERPDAKEILAAADVFVLPSLWEGLPYVLVEAAALGRPIVATDIDGVREVIRNGETGILVPAENPAELADAVSNLLGDEARARRLGERARLEIPPAYSVERMARETGALYLEVLGRETV